jgi:O-antigen/teichoic acid export membrane protein
MPGLIRKKLIGRAELQEVLNNTGWMMGDQVVRQVVGLIVGVWLARYLGPRLFGDFSYAMAVVLIASPFAMLGLDAIGIRRMVQDPSCRNEVLGTSFVLMTAGGVVAFGVAMGGIFLARPDDHLVHWLVGILSAGIVLQSLIAIEFWFESQMQWKFTVYAKTSAFLLLSLVKVGLILLEAPLIAFAWAAFADTALGSVCLVIVYRRRGYVISAWQFSLKMARSLLGDSWPLILSVSLTMIYLRIDQVMLGNMVGSEELGNYSVAVRISEAWYFIPMVICSSSFPAVFKSEAVSEELFYAHLQRLYSLMAFLAYAVALPVAFFSDEIVRLLFSTSFTDAGPLLALLIWTGVFTSLGAARNVFVLSKNWTRINLLSVGLGCALNILLNYLLIPEYEAMGAVAATFVSYWFAVHGTCFLFKPLRRTGWMITRAMIFPRAW